MCLFYVSAVSVCFTQPAKWVDSERGTCIKTFISV